MTLKLLSTLILAWAITILPARADDKDAEKAAIDAKRIAELDAYWNEITRTVREGDFAGYAATCHPEAVLVSGVRGNSTPLSVALKRWKKEFDDTKAGDRKSDVVFRWTDRVGDDTTAHETGMFRYSFAQGDEEMKSEYIHFEGLMVKRDGKWLILMEYQKSVGTKAEWDAMAK